MDTVKYKQADTCPTLKSLFEAEEVPPLLSLGYCEMCLQSLWKALMPTMPESHLHNTQ